MVGNNLLNQKIVDNRKQQAPKLKRLSSSCNDLISALTELVDVTKPLISQEEPGADNKKLNKVIKQIEAEIDRLKDLAIRIQRKMTRFESGTVSIAVCGLMKGGKTTFIKKLTGLKELPSFDEKCTAVSTEILWEKTDKSYADIYYFTPEEYVNRVINSNLQAIQAEEVSDLSQFELMDFKVDSYEEGSEERYICQNLITLQKNILIVKENLGNTQRRIDSLDTLKDEIAYPEMADSQMERQKQSARISTVRLCKIYCDFEGGSENLRLFDTAGVDDINPKVVTDTVKTLAEDTDVIVLTSRPKDAPEPGKDFYRLLYALRNIKDEIKIYDRLIFLLNWHEDIDPKKKNIQTHKHILEENGIPSSVFTEAIDCSKEDGARSVMHRINQHLSEHLESQDRRSIEQIQSSYHEISKISVWQICKEMKSLKPLDYKSQEEEIQLFNKWIISDSTRKGDIEGLLPKLRKLLYDEVKRFENTSRFKTQQDKLLSVLDEKEKEIQKKLPTQEKMNKEAINVGTTNMCEYFMKLLYGQLSELSKSLSEIGEEFAPIIQKVLVSVLSDAGLKPLLSGDTPSEKLKNLKDYLPGNDIFSSAINNALALDNSMGLILKYQLRPCVNIANPFHWSSGRAWHDITTFHEKNRKVGKSNKENDMPKDGRDPSVGDRLGTNKIAPRSIIDSAKDKIDSILDILPNRAKELDAFKEGWEPSSGKSEDLKRIANNSYNAMHCFLLNQSPDIGDMAMDVILDLQQKLSLTADKILEEEIRGVLLPLRGHLLGPTIENIQKQSKLIGQYHNSLIKVIEITESYNPD